MGMAHALTPQTSWPDLFRPSTSYFSQVVTQAWMPGTSPGMTPKNQTSRLCSSAALMKLANSGCGSKGFDFSSG